jgi:predicted TIM-barrel fold metal-dependent hydrolase
MTDFTDIIDVHSHAVFNIGQEAPMPNQPDWSVEGALEVMDRNGIAKSIISLPLAANYADGDEACEIARIVNDRIAEIIARHPKRFGGMVTLPGRSIDGSLREIEYALDILKFDAVSITTNINDVYLGEEVFDPLFEELNRRHATLFIHPINLSNASSMDLGINLSILEFMFDTTRMLTGTKQRFADINMISTHAGGTIPFLLERIQTLEVHFGAGRGRATISAEEIKQGLASFYYDLTGSTSNAQLAGLLELIPPSQLLMGVDIPFMPDWSIAPAINAVKNYPGFRPDDLALIAHGNAAALFPSCG